MKRHGRRGFFLIWAALSICIVMLLAGALMMLIGTAARHAGRAQETADAVLIGQEVMETLKTNRRFHAALPIPEAAERNGRTYRIEVMRTMEAVEGLPMETVSVTVSGGSGAVTFRSLLGGQGGLDGE